METIVHSRIIFDVFSAFFMDISVNIFQKEKLDPKLVNGSVLSDFNLYKSFFLCIICLYSTLLLIINTQFHTVKNSS